MRLTDLHSVRAPFLRAGALPTSFPAGPFALDMNEMDEAEERVIVCAIWSAQYIVCADAFVSGDAFCVGFLKQGKQERTAILFSDSSSLATLSIFFRSFFTINPSKPTCSSNCRFGKER